MLAPSEKLTKAPDSMSHAWREALGPVELPGAVLADWDMERETVPGRPRQRNRAAR